MVQFDTPIGKVKVVRKRSSTRTKVVALVAVVLSIAALLALTVAIGASKSRAEALREEALGLEGEKSRLELYIQELGTIQGIIRIAQEELGLIEPDSVIIQPE